MFCGGHEYQTYKDSGFLVCINKSQPELALNQEIYLKEIQDSKKGNIARDAPRGHGTYSFITVATTTIGTWKNLINSCSINEGLNQEQKCLY